MNLPTSPVALCAFLTSSTTSGSVRVPPHTPIVTSTRTALSRTALSTSSSVTVLILGSVLVTTAAMSSSLKVYSTAVGFPPLPLVVSGSALAGGQQLLVVHHPLGVFGRDHNGPQPVLGGGDHLHRQDLHLLLHAQHVAHDRAGVVLVEVR